MHIDQATIGPEPELSLGLDESKNKPELELQQPADAVEALHANNPSEELVSNINPLEQLLHSALSGLNQQNKQIKGQNVPEEEIPQQNDRATQIFKKLRRLNIEGKIDTKEYSELKSQLSLWDKFRYLFYDSPKPFQKFRDWFSIGLNSFGIAFNASAVVGMHSAFIPKDMGKWLDEKSEWFSRYIIPFSFAWNGIEAMAGNRVVEAISRFIPAVSFWILPFYNFNFATGASSGLNYLLDRAYDRFKSLRRPQPESSPLENLKEMGKMSWQVLKDYATGADIKSVFGESFADVVATYGMLIGSLGGLTLASKDRDSGLARLFGFMRNIGGFTGDWEFIARGDIHKRITGSSCGIASVLNILMRWVNPQIARAFNHIAIAADDFGLTYWAQDSMRRTKEKREQEEKDEMSEPSRNQPVFVIPEFADATAA